MTERHKPHTLTPEEMHRISVFNRHRFDTKTRARDYTKDDIIQATLEARRNVHDTEIVHHAKMHDMNINEDERQQAEMDYLLAQMTLAEYEKSIAKRGISVPEEK